ncbi:MAG TPA: LUD domain-containing protein, partial [Planctomycetaceae bacterium]|nr:LUD domain-containing protein [Planctomycetaceae bacterium]
MESSRDAILNAVRSRQVPPVAAPGPFTHGIRYADPQKQFSEALALVGGEMLVAQDAADANRQLAAIPRLASAAVVCSLVEGVLRPTVDLARVDDPHMLEKVDVAVLPGDFAVAENAAVWFSGRHVKHRVIPFITQHLVLVVPAGELVHNMHEAFARLQFAQAQFGTFISGPS